jgi:predicted RNase H-like HicB family nuclease/predicted RNA binding protein YcfA (HicA-like mRNA interferase family)
MESRVVIEEDNDAFVVYCPELPGCQSFGHTEEEAKKNIEEAEKLYLRPSRSLPDDAIDSCMNSTILRSPYDEVITVLENVGFELIDQEGIHQKWRHSYGDIQIILPYSKVEPIRPKLLKQIQDGARYNSQLGATIAEFIGCLLF